MWCMVGGCGMWGEVCDVGYIIIIIIIHKHLYSAKYQPSVLMRSL